MGSGLWRAAASIGVALWFASSAVGQGVDAEKAAKPPSTAGQAAGHAAAPNASPAATANPAPTAANAAPAATANPPPAAPNAAPPAAPPPAPRVEFFSPRGTAKQVRQATARFSAPMVALGDPRLADPFAVSCPAPGKGRWADPRNWIYDFDADLPAGMRCTFALKPNLTTLDKRPLAGTRTFSFDTGGPAIVASFPHDGWVALDEDQVFLLKSDAPPTIQSVLQNAYCVIEGIAERIPVEVLTGDARRAVLDQRKQLGYAYFALLWKSGAVSDVRVRDRSLERAEDTITALKCQRRLPPSTRVQLVWGAGIAAASGIATQQPQQLAFQVRPEFTAMLECTRTEPRAGCTPTQPITVRFSAPVPAEQAFAARLVIAGGETRTPSNAGKPAKVVESIEFKPPFPDGASATLQLPAQLVDDAGRTLANAARFPLDVRIDEYPPLVKFASDLGILEAQEGGVLPVTLRNLDAGESGGATTIHGRQLRVANDPAAVSEWLQRVTDANAHRGEWQRQPNGESKWHEETGAASVFKKGDDTTPLSIAKPQGARPAEVVGIPLRTPGLYVVELESRRLGQSLLGRDAIRYVSTAALVTNLSVHFKWGRESSRVWVTRLDNGQPVPDAQVVVSAFCYNNLLWSGKTDRDGVATIDNSLGEPHDNERCNKYSPSPLLVTARAPTSSSKASGKVEEDFSFVLSGWNKGISPHDFGLKVGSTYEVPIFHTVLDRPLFRAGETVSMKHFIRRHVSQGIALPPGDASRDRTVTISHYGSGQKYTFTAHFDANGVAEQTWKIPAEAKLGEYAIEIQGDTKNDVRTSGQFKVEEFRLPTMRASVQGPARPLVRPATATLDLHVAYVSGGGASGMPVKLRTVVEPWPLPHPGYDDFRFGGAPVREGVQVNEGSRYDLDFEEESAPESGSGAKAQVLPVTLDEQGAARVTLTSLPAIENPSVLTAELEYSDASGEVLTTSGRVHLVPAALSVGIRPEGWAASSEQMRFRIVVLDLDGKPVPKRQVTATLFNAARYSYRKRLIGGFYTYETAQENTKLKATCAGKTNAQGLLVCEVAPGVSGEVLVRAEARDDDGRMAGATTSIWVAGKDEWWFGGTAGDRMDVLPENPEYDVGQVARFQVRMPFREATALVTVEREGVLRSFVTRLSGKEPVVKVPIQAADSPNVYVSVLALRGRIGKSWRKTNDGKEITALVDLNKPAYRLGTAEIRVGWQPHRLDVRVSTDRPTYAIREQAKVHIEVKRADGTALPAGAEVALAAVDEALLELAPNDSWKLLDAMMGRRGLEVWTSTAQLQVVGKRHYGRKAVPHGGGGGRERARESFDTLLAWQGRVKLDADGKADVTVPLNDSLTSFEIVAVAHASTDLFGTGSTSIATSQDLILLSGLPPVVREGDRFAATFTVRNTTQASMTVDVAANVLPKDRISLDPKRIEIPAGQARDVTWDVTVPVRIANLAWDVSANHADGSARDHIKVSETVKPVFPVRTYQATIAQLTAPLELPAARPKEAAPGRGGLELTLRAKLGDGLDGVREYMSFYSYTCLEQNLSRAVALSDKSMWDTWMDRLPAYMDDDGLLRYFPTDRLQGEDVLTSYVLAIAGETGWAIPDAARARMIEALQKFVDGRIVRRSALDTADLAVRKLAAINALARFEAAQPKMLDSITLEPNLWPTSAVIDWLGILRRVRGIPDAERKRDMAESILRTRLNFQGTIMTFSTERTDALWWLMISSDSNAVRALLELMDRPGWRDDVPRLVRGALGRQQRGHWNTTVANAWGVVAMQKFSAAFEQTPVTGNTTVRYGTRGESVHWPRAAPAELQLPWQNGASGTTALTVDHDGAGAPWVIVRATAALPLEKPLSTGFTVKRSVTAVEQKQAGRWSRGDVARVRLELEAQSDMSWVVVDDPVPGGATVLGSGLGGQSQILTSGERREGWVWPAFEERRFDAFRAYYRFVPKGRWVVEYTVRLNNPGTFLLPATRVEAMYAPEMLGEAPNAAVTVEPAP
ncbi:MAG TPA: MG2 domain-containing protein [Steroidobacteraceae bacterium]|nr:MG2 domain-containing protein [Steroidobacteraceae bacterium]